MRAVKILERILCTLPIMLGVAVIVFFFIRLTPGDPVDIMMGRGGAVSATDIEQLRHQFHLDRPLHVQLWYFLRDAARGNLGYSYIRNKPVVELLAERLPATIELTLGSLLVSLLIATPIGILSAVRQNSLLDRFSMGGAFLGISMPNSSIVSLKARRSSPRLIASGSTPMTLTLYFSSAPHCAKLALRFRPVCPPRLGRMASGRSFSIILIIVSRLSGSM